MARPLSDGDCFVDDADASQPRITITIDGGPRLTNAERTIRDEMIAPFIDEFVLAVRNFYVGRQMLGPQKRRCDATLAAAIAETPRK